MYETNPEAGVRWLAELKDILPEDAAHVVSVRPALQESRYGGTDLFAFVVVDDGVFLMPKPQYMELLKRLDKGLTSVILDDPNRPGEGWPVFLFRTMAEYRSPRTALG